MMNILDRVLLVADKDPKGKTVDDSPEEGRPEEGMLGEHNFEEGMGLAHLVENLGKHTVLEELNTLDGPSACSLDIQDYMPDYLLGHL